MMFAMMLAMADFAPRALPEAKKAEVQRLAEVELLDGRSARFIWPKQRDAGAYCGFVNAKNSLGAYTGYKPFYVSVSGKAESLIILAPDLGHSRTIVDLFSKACTERGYSLSPSESGAP